MHLRARLEFAEASLYERSAQFSSKLVTSDAMNFTWMSSCAIIFRLGTRSENSSRGVLKFKS